MNLIINQLITFIYGFINLTINKSVPPTVTTIYILLYLIVCFRRNLSKDVTYTLLTV